MTKKILLLTMLTSSFAQANTLDNLSGPLGGLYQKMKANFTTSNSFSVVESQDKEECLDNLEDLIDDSKPNEIKSITYFRSPIEEHQIKGAYNKEISSAYKERYTPGLKAYSGVSANSFSEENAIHLQPGCKKYMQVNNVEMVEINLPSNKMAKCRKVNLGIDNLDYNIFYCEGENDLFANYAKDLNFKVLESVQELSN